MLIHHSQQAQARRKASGWQQAVQIALQPLEALDYITSSYCQGVIENTLQWGPYYVIAPGVAMPHARPEQGARANSLAITTFETPVSFGHEDCDPVWLVIALSATDANAHLETIQHITTLLEDSALLARLQQATTDNELFQLISNPTLQEH
ncbi:MAG: PTS sugar transporter subunit IIA [Buttiauxella noackiae]|nr:PTS sugar transporter subunit IIA [Buttiauxella noackiae]MCA1922919.1 PTS sugar transporter subunit IIA [Buttiauxella noackiae]